MNNRIRQIVQQIAALEDELNAAVEEHEQRLRYQLEGKRVVFEQAVREAHQRVKLGLFRWFLTVRPQNYLTMPVIYGAAVPLALFDLCISLYQLICFPVYRIARVKRVDYIVYDHQHLAYLNAIEKAHCLYCSYAVGLLAYAGEIIARTEQYFCPIKHARKVLAAHNRYDRFLEYGEADDFHGKLEAFRAELAKEKAAAASRPEIKEHP
ncbi:hypothetical protein FGKAn22_16380 [Ferrigenium kumadai]|uniref:Uncharacterized protein n=1 Tax=Ferrigenium kumadai TaxID=1682490 RepID=A0AAN1T137_9PROT|nr:hypothetical protein [Ferrigenium kumadai]BBI99945.1 hypothetical protein FGKAn22_16380 [Ferrigenium kumadai]